MSKILDRIMSIIENNFGSCECPEDEHCSFCACKEEIAPLLEIQTKRVENLKNFLSQGDELKTMREWIFTSDSLSRCQAIDQELEKELENLK